LLAKKPPLPALIILNFNLGLTINYLIFIWLQFY